MTEPRKPIFGYKGIVAATLGITVWAARRNTGDSRPTARYASRPPRTGTTSVVAGPL